MINQTIKDRMDQLYEQLNLYNYQYYVLDSPTIEDTEYDSLIRELEELEKAYPKNIQIKEENNEEKLEIPYCIDNGKCHPYISR